MTSVKSDAYQQFVASVEGNVGSFDALRSYDLAALQGIREDEHGAALDVLRNRCRDDDPRVVSALLTLGTADAWQVLMGILTGEPSITVATAAHRVWEHRGAPEAVDALRACLNAPDTEVSSLAMRIVGRIDMPLLDHVKRGLYAAHFETRVAAVSTLLDRYGLEEYNNIVGSPVFHLALGVGSRLEPMFRDAADRLCSLLAEMDGGASPQSLGLVVAKEPTRGPVQALVGALLHGHGVLERNLLVPLTPGERDYAVEFLSKAISRGDMRVLPLLKELGTPRANLALSCVE